MDQKTIMDALKKALANGSGTLDDLDNLLKRAQADVAKAKEEQRAAEEKKKKEYANKITDLANRLLNGKTTDDDCALVINAWLEAKGMSAVPFKGEDLAKIFTACADAPKQPIDLDAMLNSSELERALKEFSETMAELGRSLNTKPDKKVEKVEPKKKDEESVDDVINNFLRSFGLR